SRSDSSRPLTRSSTTSTVTLMSCRVWVRLTERNSSLGAAPNTSAAIHGVESGSSNQWMNEVMPACATSPTAERRPGGMSPYQGRVSSNRFSVAVASSPETVFSHASVCSLLRATGAIYSCSCRLALATGRAGGSRCHVVQSVAIDRLLRNTRVDLAPCDQGLQSAHDERRSVDLEEPPGGRASVGESIVVGAEREVVAGNELANLVGHRVHVVTHPQERSLGALQLACQVRLLGLFVGIEEVVLLRGESIAAQLAPRRDGPHVSGHVPVFGEQLLGLKCPRHRHAGGKQLRLRSDVLCLIEQVDAVEKTVDVEVLGFGRLLHRLVVDGDVVHDIRMRMAAAVHPFEARLHDEAEFITVGGVVRDDREVGRCEQRR